MEKFATNVDEQIAKLESRGMTISNKDKAKECLLDIGYFRLGFYWFPFEKSYPRKANRTHEFKEGTCFEYAIRLYYFDYDLRNILLKYINRVEINFRTKLIYHASNRYKQAPFWYQDSKYVNKAFLEDDVMEKAMKFLDDMEVPFEVNALSAHRTPDAVEAFAKNAARRGIKVIIAGAGMAAALPGVIAASTTLPVIGVPIKGSVLDGVDALYSILQMPPGIPVATVAINGAMNAAILACQMIALGDEAMAKKLSDYKMTLGDKIEKANRELKDIKYNYKV